MNTQQKQASALPDPGAAYENLFNRVHTQVFLGKLAQAYGVGPRPEKQAEDTQYLLALAGRLRQVKQAEKAASDVQSNPFAGALAALDGVLGNQGQDGFLKAALVQEEQMAIKEAAAELMSDPSIYNCILSLAAFEADQAMAQLQQQ